MAISELGSAASQPLQTDRWPTATQASPAQAGRDTATEQPPVQATSPDVQVTLSAEAQRLAVSPQQQVPNADETEGSRAESALGAADEREPARANSQPSASETLGTNIDIQA